MLREYAARKPAAVPNAPLHGGAERTRYRDRLMPKRPLKLVARIPCYRGPRNAWRRAVHREAWLVKESQGLAYGPGDHLEIVVRLYLEDAALTCHDVDNRLKDVLDALQGRAGGSKRRPTLPPIIPNDSQVYRVVIEKGLPPKQSGGLGHLTIRRFAGRG